MRKPHILSALLPLSLAFAGCVADKTGPGPDPQPTSSECSDPGAPVCVVASEKQRVLSPSVWEVWMEDLVGGNTRFALDLYKELSAEPGNLFYSPYSISSALAMTYAGARTETEKQMASTLHFTVPQEHLHPAFNALDQLLASHGERVEGPDGEGPISEGFKLHIANALWGQVGHPFEASFLDTLAENYGAGINVVDFIQAHEQARQVINGWVADRTEDRIQDLLPQGVLDASTRLVLTNAIYFNAAWKFPFKEEATAPGDFTRLDGSTVSVPMMTNTAEIVYYHNEEEGYEAVELPYDGADLSMLIVLPSDLGAFEVRLQEMGSLLPIAPARDPRPVTLTMPKFRVESAFALVPTLKALGMTAPFADADFSGIDGSRDLFISDVIHKAFVSVDEAGTEAAAATAVVIGRTSAGPEPVTLRLDRPFVFFIRDDVTGTVLFAGRVADPSK